MSRPHPTLLVNLPSGFYRTPSLAAAWERLDGFGDVRRASHDTADQIAFDLRWAESVLMWSWPPLTAELLARAPHLKFAAHIDVSQRAARAALERGLPLSVSRSGFSPAVAEMALALILSTYRRVSDYHGAMRAGEETWVTSFPDTIDPGERELSDRVVGIVGFGRVGRRLRELLVPFHCRVLVCDPFLAPNVATEAKVEVVSLIEMLVSCDVVVLCAAANEGTQRLLGPGEIARLRDDAVLINVARASLVDSDALITRLRRGGLVAALDVFDPEPMPADHPLRTLPNCYLTPHRAGGTLASVSRIVDYLIDDLAAFWSGEPLRHALTPDMISSLDA